MPRPRVDYIGLLAGVHDDDKSVFSAKQLGLDVDSFIGKITRLWIWLLVHRQSDSLEGLTAEMVANICNFQGNAAKFEQVLIKNRWIKKKGAKKIASGWSKINGSRIRELQRKQRYYNKMRRERLDAKRSENRRPFVRTHPIPISKKKSDRNLVAESLQARDSPSKPHHLEDPRTDAKGPSARVSAARRSASTDQPAKPRHKHPKDKAHTFALRLKDRYQTEWPGKRFTDRIWRRALTIANAAIRDGTSFADAYELLTTTLTEEQRK